MSRYSVVLVLLTVALLASLARADFYVLGASYTAYGIDQPPPGPGGELMTGDEVWSDGHVWVTAYAAATGQPVPISSTRTPDVGETPTNFARGGAQIINTSGGGGGVTRPKSADEQWLECKDYLAANGPPNAADVFVSSSFGNDILIQYEIGESNVVDPGFLAERVNAMKAIIDEAIAIGFQTILISTLPPLERTPAIINDFSPAIRAEFDADIEEFNDQLICMLRELAGNTQITVLWLDMASVISEVADAPQSYGFIDNSSAIHDCDTGADEELVMWWDCLHPAANLHELMAGRVEVFPATEIVGNSDFDDAMDLEQWGDDYLEGGGTFVVANQRLEYRVPSPDAGAEDYAARPWIATSVCYSCDWEVVLELTNSVTPAVGQTALIGLGVFNLKDFPNSIDSIHLGIYANGDASSVERGIEAGFIVNDVDFSPANQVITPDTTGAVRLVFNANSKVFSAYYHLDEAADGITWQFLGSFGLAGSGGSIANGNWEMGSADTFDVYVIGSSSGSAIQAGEAYADNFAFLMPSPALPTLQIQLTNNDVQLLWPASAINYGLESSLDLTPGSWTPITQPATVQNSVYSLVVPLNGDRQFFRLRR